MTNYIRLLTAEVLPPFQGGLAGLFGYGLNRILESRVPRTASTSSHRQSLRRRLRLGRQLRPSVESRVARHDRLRQWGHVGR